MNIKSITTLNKICFWIVISVYSIRNKVHILINGRIVKSGGKELALEIETNGYDNIEQSLAKDQHSG